MADNRYRNRERGSYGRSDSIFDDDDRNRQGSGRNREDRSFFQRAGEEVRSWLGGDDEGRRGGSGRGDYFQGRSGPRQDRGGNFDRSYGGSSGTGGVQSLSEANHGQGPQDGDEPWGGGSDWSAGRQQNWRGDMGQGSFSQTSGGGSPFDDHYRSWRDRQIDQLDREYDEYRQHRQQQFESDFTNWRQNRDGQSRAGQQQGDNAGGDRTGSQGQTEGGGTTSTQGGSSRAMASGGATAEGGSNLTPGASTGSSGRQSPRSRKS